MIRLLVLLLAMTLPAQAEEVVAGLSQNRVSIDANFDGSEILIFGAIKRESPIPTEPPLAVIITIAGPDAPVTVRRKERTAGIWVNRDAVEIDLAPSLYAVATSGPLSDVLRDTEDLRHQVTIQRAIRSVGAPDEIQDAAAFTEALIRIRSNNGLYQHLESAVRLKEETLFDARLALPANLVQGSYETRIFLTRGGEVVSVYETEIDVRKVGLERLLYTMAHERPLIYGVMSLVIAIVAGWLASAVFRYLQS